MENYAERRGRITQLLRAFLSVAEHLVHICAQLFKKTPPPPPPSKGYLLRQALAKSTVSAFEVVADQIRELAPNLIRLGITIALECTSLGTWVAGNKIASTTARFMGF